MRWDHLSAVGISRVAFLLLGAASWLSEALAQEGRPPQNSVAEATAMFRRLDANGDGKLTKSEARSSERALFDNIFRMAGKSDSESISSAEFQRVFEQHRRNGGGPGNRPPGGEERPNDRRPMDARPNESRPNESRSNESRPNDRRPSDRRPPREGERGASRERTAGTSTEGNGSPRERTRGAGANRITGLWRGWVVDGRGENPNAGHMQMELRIENNRMTAREIGNRGGGGEGLGDGNFVVSAEGNSGNLDATGTSGRYDGVEYLGIFEVEGDTLKWCVGNRGKPRPGDYSTGRGNYYMILRRVEEPKRSS